MVVYCSGVKGRIEDDGSVIFEPKFDGQTFYYWAAFLADPPSVDNIIGFGTTDDQKGL